MFSEEKKSGYRPSNNPIMVTSNYFR